MDGMGKRVDHLQAMKDDWNLQRFVDAQGPVWHSVLAELQAGRKRTHWMWFVFPQLAGLGRSSTARFYGLSGLDEARAYLAHPLLGPRLTQCTEALLAAAPACTAHDIFGSPDDLKLRSCLTLFDLAAEGRGPFHPVLARFYAGAPDEATLALLARPAPAAGTGA